MTGSDASKLVRLVYLSSAELEMGVQELSAILACARKNNSANDITGLLIYHDGSFMQILEGPSEAVRETYDRIETDPMHSGLIMLQNTEIEERAFSRWTMGFVGAESLSGEMKDSLLELSRLAEPIDTTLVPKSENVARLIDTFLSAFRGFEHLLEVA